MKKVILFLRGKKTYLTAVIIIVVGVIIESPEMIAIGVGMLPMRAAIK